MGLGAWAIRNWQPMSFSIVIRLTPFHWLLEGILVKKSGQEFFPGDRIYRIPELLDCLDIRPIIPTCASTHAIYCPTGFEIGAVHLDAHSGTGHWEAGCRRVRRR